MISILFCKFVVINLTLMTKNLAIIDALKGLNVGHEPIFLTYEARLVRGAAAAMGNFAVKPVPGGCMVAFLGNSTEQNALSVNNRVKMAIKNDRWPAHIRHCKASYVQELLRKNDFHGLRVIQQDGGVVIFPRDYKLAPLASNAIMQESITEADYSEVMMELERIAKQLYSKLPVHVRQRTPDPMWKRDEPAGPDEGIIMKRSWEVSDDII